MSGSSSVSASRGKGNQLGGARSQHAFLRYKTLDKWEAMMVGRNKAILIIVNDRSRPERQRFSVDHEIGIGTTTISSRRCLLRNPPSSDTCSYLI